MNLFTTSLYVAFGGGLGAVCRYLIVEYSKHIPIMAEYVVIMLINIVGCFLIGLIFFILEALLRRDGNTRLPRNRFEHKLPQVTGLFEEDPTLQAVDHFRSDQRLRFLSGLLITGFLGGFTTFSSYCLYSVRLFHDGMITEMLLNMVLSPLLAMVAVGLGIRAANKIVVFLHLEKDKAI